MKKFKSKRSSGYQWGPGGARRQKPSSNAAQWSHHYIPYRESKLTTILRQSLGGNAYCLMIANLSPLAQFLDENLQTLQYASKAQHISNQPKVNQDPRAKLIMEQKQYIDKL